LNLLRPLTTSAALEAVHAALRRKVPSYEQDRPHYPDIRAARELIESGALLDAAVGTLGKGVLS
jgi:histidine ammonia-lyase